MSEFVVVAQRWATWGREAGHIVRQAADPVVRGMADLRTAGIFYGLLLFVALALVSPVLIYGSVLFAAGVFVGSAALYGASVALAEAKERADACPAAARDAISRVPLAAGDPRVIARLIWEAAQADHEFVPITREYVLELARARNLLIPNKALFVEALGVLEDAGVVVSLGRSRVLLRHGWLVISALLDEAGVSATEDHPSITKRPVSEVRPSAPQPAARLAADPDAITQAALSAGDQLVFARLVWEAGQIEHEPSVTERYVRSLANARGFSAPSTVRLGEVLRDLEYAGVLLANGRSRKLVDGPWADLSALLTEPDAQPTEDPDASAEVARLYEAALLDKAA